VSRRDVIDAAGIVLLGLVLIGLLYVTTVAVRDHVAEVDALPE